MEGHDIADEYRPFRELSAHAHLSRVYEDSIGNKLNLYVGYFDHQEQGTELVGEESNWLHEQSDTVRIRVKSKVIEVGKVDARQRNDKKTFYFWYDINGQITANRYLAKLASLHDALVQRRTNGALIAVAVERKPSISDIFEESDGLRFVKETLPLIETHLSGGSLEKPKPTITQPQESNLRKKVNEVSTLVSREAREL